jgi:hypothetical protein
MLEYAHFIFLAYVITFIIASSSVFEPIRSIIKSKLQILQIGDNKHFIECRMCIGFWVSLIACVVANKLDLFFVVYGASYFLATQER